MFNDRLAHLWDDLRSKKRFMPEYLERMQIDGLRGFDNVEVSFDYPVTVIAGGNASGKTTALFAAACAYWDPSSTRNLHPEHVFPHLSSGHHQQVDSTDPAVLSYEYMTDGKRTSMAWQRRWRWVQAFPNEAANEQLQRSVFLRTLDDLGMPLAMRGAYGATGFSPPDFSKNVEERPFNTVQIEWAERMLPFKYRSVVDLSRDHRHLLFATLADQTAYSELHMASGERVTFELARRITEHPRTLVLIDELETSLHPFVQQLLMTELQQLALRNDIQVIVTSHSPVVLDSVPLEARVFLDRGETGKVTVQAPYRDIVEDALYGRATDGINILCEDEVAEGMIDGLIDVLQPRLGLRVGWIRIGRDTGADEFPGHANAFRKFGQIDRFIFVLDGDQQNTDIEDRINAAAGMDVPVVFLPGFGAPEEWIWMQLQRDTEGLADVLGIGSAELSSELRRLDSLFDSASDGPANIAKAKIGTLANALNRTVPELCRIGARFEAEKEFGDMRLISLKIEEAIRRQRGLA